MNKISSTFALNIICFIRFNILANLPTVAVFMVLTPSMKFLLPVTLVFVAPSPMNITFALVLSTVTYSL